MTSGRMLSSERLDVEVEVEIDGVWFAGFLEHRRHVDDRWEGFVRWSTAPGENRIGWLDYDNLRPSVRAQPPYAIAV